VPQLVQVEGGDRDFSDAARMLQGDTVRSSSNGDTSAHRQPALAARNWTAASEDRDGDANCAGHAIRRGRRVARVRSIRPSDRNARPA
jgi:hypothetical protein